MQTYASDACRVPVIAGSCQIRVPCCCSQLCQSDLLVFQLSVIVTLSALSEGCVPLAPYSNDNPIGFEIQ